MLEFRNQGKHPPDDIQNYVLFDTGVTKTCFRHPKVDFVKIFIDSYHHKYKSFTVHNITTPFSLLELLGCAPNIGPELYDLDLEESKANSYIEFFEANVKTIHTQIIKKISPEYLKSKLNEELLYPPNDKVRIFLTNGESTFLNNKENLDIFYHMLSISFLLMNNHFIERMNALVREQKNHEIGALLEHIAKNSPNQSLAHALFSFYAKNSDYYPINGIKTKNISAKRLKELLDFEAVHFLTRGFSQNSSQYKQVILVTTENDHQKWIDRCSFYRKLLMDLKINTFKEMRIFSMNFKDPKKSNWFKFTTTT